MKITKTKGVQKSDHNPLITELNIECNYKVIKEKVEFFNFKNKNCQKKFKEVTSNTTELSKIFDNDADINKLTKHFIRKLNNIIYKCF